MAKFVISKFFSIVMFIVMMILFFFWISAQTGDLTILFGFRTSHTVANDIANSITSVGAVPGSVGVNYDITQSPSANNFKYNIRISDRIVCVKSYLFDEGSSTSDCASHPYDLDTVNIDGVECVRIHIEKSDPSENVVENTDSIKIEELSRTCQR